ncbi:MAG TPA: protein kinase [Kofleriaceae bacterium]|nr:protein kinase [Kofleriaceae bacterium]
MTEDAEDETRQDRPSRPSRPSGNTSEADFGPRYRVLARLGAGGMGEVYRAYDTQLKGNVALKIVRGDVDHDSALARFRREIALARKVTSPNVLRVYDLAEHEGLQFLSMELVEGEDLAALLKREKRLPPPRALALFRQVCLGLLAAHAEGVVHRDLKPQNVLVDKDDRVRVADFGLARSIGESGLTVTGEILGSPAYMSPEQVKGEPADERSDIYSAGVMLYQLITGTTPFKGDSAHQVMEVRLHKAPRPIAEVVEDAPPFVQRIVSRCLQLDPAQRYPSIASLIEELDRAGAATEPVARGSSRARYAVLGGAAGVVLAAGAVLAVLHAREPGEVTPAPAANVPAPPAPVPPTKPGAQPALPTTGLVTVVVLPFENRTSEPAFESMLDTVLYFALRRSERIDPIGGGDLRAEAAALGSDVALDDVGKRLAERDRVEVVVARGTITSENAGFTLTLTAKNAGAGTTLVSKTAHAGSLGDVIAADVQLASELRVALGEQLTADERTRNSLSASLEADREFTLGRDLSNVGDDENALAHLERAVAKDPEFAWAHDLLAVTNGNLGHDVSARASYALAIKGLDRIGERDRLKILGDYYRTVTEDYDRAVESYRQLLAKWPADPSAETNLSWAYEAMPNARLALEAAQRAAEHHPRDPIIRSNLPTFEIGAGQFTQAKQACEEAVRSSSRPDFQVYFALAFADVLLGDRDDALAAYAKIAELAPPVGTEASADFAIGEGRLAEATAMLEQRSAADLKAHSLESYEIDQLLLAEARLRQGNKAAARVAATHVTKDPGALMFAAFVELAAGDDKRALAIAAKLSHEVARSRRASAKAIEAEALRVHGKPLDSMVAFEDVIHTEDKPLYHLWYARAAIDAGHFAEAYHDLQLALARRGEAALNFGGFPAYRIVPLFTYYLAKAQTGLGSPAAKASYQAFLAMLHEPDASDIYAADARAHAR